MSTSKYGKNRNQWKRTYPYTNRKPVVTKIQDDLTNQTLHLDLNRFALHRDYFELTAAPLLQLGYTAEYEEGLIFFNNSDEAQGTFVRCFDNVPYVTYAPESASYGVNVFGIEGEPSATTFKVGSSAPFTGYVRYRAVALNSSTPYPKFIDFPTGGSTGSFWIAAGTASLDVTQTQFTASFNIPFNDLVDLLEFRLESHDALGNTGSNVDFQLGSLSSTRATGLITAPLYDRIHFQTTSKIREGAPTLLFWDSEEALFANSSARYIWDYDGLNLYGPYGVNVPAVATINGEKFYQSEGSRENRLVDLGTWTPRGAVTRIGNQTDPAKGVGAYLIEHLGTYGINDIYSNLPGGGANSAPLGPSLFTKRQDSTSVWTIYGNSPSDGEWTVDNSLLSDGWERLTSVHPAVTVVTPFANTAAGNGRLIFLDTGGDTSALIWQPQLPTDGAYPTSPIAASSTRNADTLLISSSNVPSKLLTNLWEVTVIPEFGILDLGVSESHNVFSVGDGNNYLRLHKHGGGSGSIELKAGGDSGLTLNPFPFTANTPIKIRVDLRNALSVSLMASSSDGYSSTIAPLGSRWPSGQDLKVGFSGSAEHFDGLIGQPKQITTAQQTPVLPSISGLSARWRADTNVTDNGTNVTKWEDFFGVAGNDLLQSTGSINALPDIQHSSSRGRETIRFNPADSLSLADPTKLHFQTSLSQSFLVIQTMFKYDLPSWSVHWAHGTTGATTRNYRGFVNGTDNLNLFLGTDTLGGLTSDSPRKVPKNVPVMLAWGIDAMTSEVIYVINGVVNRKSVPAIKLTGAIDTVLPFRMMSDETTAYDDHTVDLAEVLVYQRPSGSGFDDAEITSLYTNYFNPYYRLDQNLSSICGGAHVAGYDAKDLGVSGTDVTSSHDISPGHHYPLADAGSGPPVLSSSSGFTAISFDKTSSQKLQGTGLSPNIANSGDTLAVLVVAQYRSVANSSSLLEIGGLDDGLSIFLDGANLTARADTLTSGDIDATKAFSDTASMHVFRAHLTTTEIILAVDGVASSTAALGGLTNNLTEITLGGKATGTTFDFDGFMFEVHILKNPKYSQVLDSERFLRNKYNI